MTLEIVTFLTRARIRVPFHGKIVLLKQRQNYNPRGEVSCLPASSSRTVVPLLTTTSRRSPPFAWCYVSVKACRSSSRPSLTRRPVLGRTATSPTSFPLEEPSHGTTPPRTSLRLARQVSASQDKSRLRLVRGPRRTTQATLPMREEERISTSREDNSWRPCRRPAPARALMRSDKPRSHHIAIISYSATRKTQPEALKHPLRRARA
jgi:hypothetical protein